MDLKSTCTQNSLVSILPTHDSNAIKDINSTTKISNYILKDFFYKEYAISTIEAVDIHLNLRDENGLYFTFCWEGKMAISTDIQTTELDELQSAIILDSNLNGVSLKLKKDTIYRFCIIGFNQPLTDRNLSYVQFKEMFFNEIHSDKKIFIGAGFLKLIRYIDKLSKRVKQNTFSPFVIEGLIYQIIGLKIEHLVELANKTNMNQVCLNEYKQIKNLAEKIKQNPGYEYSIEYLCKDSNLSPLILQKGFKKIFRCTAIDYIRNVRLEKALMMMKSTNLSISENCV